MMTAGQLAAGWDVGAARRDALFASDLQPSDATPPEAVADAISRTVRRLGVEGCLARVAQEYGDHPEEAACRMRWVRQLTGETPEETSQ